MGGGRQFIVAVAPRKRQLALLQELEAIKSKELLARNPEMEKGKGIVPFIIILLNARLRGTDRSEVQDEVCDASNPVFHFTFTGPEGDGILFHTLFQEWV